MGVRALNSLRGGQLQTHQNSEYQEDDQEDCGRISFIVKRKPRPPIKAPNSMLKWKEVKFQRLLVEMLARKINGTKHLRSARPYTEEV